MSNGKLLPGATDPRELADRYLQIYQLMQEKKLREKQQADAETDRKLSRAVSEYHHTGKMGEESQKAWKDVFGTDFKPKDPESPWAHILDAPFLSVDEKKNAIKMDLGLLPKASATVPTDQKMMNLKRMFDAAKAAGNESGMNKILKEMADHMKITYKKADPRMYDMILDHYFGEEGEGVRGKIKAKLKEHWGEPTPSTLPTAPQQPAPSPAQPTAPEEDLEEKAKKYLGY